MEIDNRVKAYLAKVLYESGMVKESAQFIRELVAEKFVFQGDSRELVFHVWRSLVNPMRTTVATLKDIENYNENQEIAIRAISKEIKTNSEEVISMLKEHLIPNSPDDCTSGIYYRGLGDFQRYLTEVTEGEEKDALIKESQSSYEQALKLLFQFKDARIELYLSTVLNLGILYGDVVLDKKKAYDTVYQIHHSEVQGLAKHSEEARARIKDILDLMESSLERWQ